MMVKIFRREMATDRCNAKSPGVAVGLGGFELVVGNLQRQRAAPVGVPDGPAAGGGVWSTTVDPGVPLGPGLLATCLLFDGPHVRIATATMNAAAITANVIEPPRS